MDALTHAPDAAHASPTGSRSGSRANFFARPAPDCESFPLPRFTAWLNHTDRIISLPSHWDRFAAMIGEPGLNRDSVLGRPVGSFIGDETSRELFRILLEHTRSEGRPAHISARCDACDGARALQLRLIPMSAGAIECSWFFLQGTMALEIPRYTQRVHEVDEHVRMCSWCHRIHHDGGWEAIESALYPLGALDHGRLPPITHGICPDCAVTLAASGNHLRAI